MGRPSKNTTSRLKNLKGTSGHQKATVEDITEAADVGKGTFFNYFPTKEHVLATFGGERIAAMERALESAKRGPVLPALRELAIGLAGQSAESPALLRAIYAAHASCAPVRAELQKRLRKGRRILTEIYILAQERGEVRRDLSPAELGRLTQIVLLGVSVAWAMNPDTTLRATAKDVWDLLFTSIRADDKSRALARRSVNK